MTWNFRTFEHPQDDTEETYLTVHEVYYDDEGKADSFVCTPTSPRSREEAMYVLKAFDKPVAGSLDDKTVTINEQGHLDFKNWSWSPTADEPREKK